MKKVLSVILAFALIFSAVPLSGVSEYLQGWDFGFLAVKSSAASTSDLSFSLNSDGASYRVSDCSESASGKLTIPSTYNGKPVTSIGDWAFSYCISLTSVTIPDSVTSIKDYAFSYCSSLTSVTIPDSVTSIDDHAFYNCKSLTSVTIGNSVTSIGWGAFNGTAYYDNRANWENGALYMGKCLISVEKSLSGAYTVKDGTKCIADSAFYDCSKLTLVTIGNGVTSIGCEAFYYCSSLTSINAAADNKYYSSQDGVLFNKDKTELICCPAGKSGQYTVPGSVTSIGEWAFEYCSSLTSVTIPGSVTSIGGYAFEGCSSLKSVNIPDSVTSIGEGAFEYCSSLNAVYITDIAAWCGIEFDSSVSNPLCYANNLYVNGKLATDIVIPDSVTSIGVWAFYDCRSLTSVTIPDSVTNIGGSAFSGCTGLTSVTIGNSVTSIGNEAFYNCSSLKLIEIPDGVTSIGRDAFYNTAYYNNNANWENGVRYMGKYLIEAETSLSGEYTVKDGTKCIADYAFLYCSSLTSVTIPDSVTNIGYCAFYGCSSLTSVTIGDGVTSIGDWAFSYCISLTSVTIPNGVTSIGRSAFKGCSSLTSVTIPDSVTSIGEDAFRYCENLTSVTIPDSVTSIGRYAFSNCSSNLVIYAYENSTAAKFAVSEGITLIIISRCVDSDNDYICDKCGEWICDIIPDTTKEINVEAYKTTLLEFTPYVTGFYAFIADSDGDTCGYLYDADMNQIAYDDDSAGNSDFKIKYTLEAGKTYYFGARFYSSNIAGSFKVSLSETSPFTFTLNSDGNSYTLSGCDSSYIGALTVPSTYNGKPVTNIGFAAFCDCTGLTSVTIPDSVTVISNKAFYGCKNLATVTIPNTVSTIGYITFYDCKSLTNVTIPDSVKSIGDCAFEGCGSLETVTVGNGVTSIGKYAFGYCSKLKSAEIPIGVTSIDDTAFFSCGGDLVVYGFRGSYAESYANKNSLTFKATEIISKGSARIDYANNCIFSDETISSLDECLVADKNIALECVKSSLGAIGTGATVRVKTGNTVLGNYTVVVNGDLDGDSVCDVLDAVLTERAANGHGELSAAQAYAANGCADTEIDAASYQSVVNKALSA